jgi:N utilization substance protein A
LLTAALVVEEAADHPLRDLDGMTDTIASALGERQIDSIQTLAEACVDELEGIDGLSGELAGKLIMGARKVWFGA